MEQTTLPVEFNSVAGASMIVLITAMMGKTSGENPYTLIISISPIIPPPGSAPITAPTRKATPTMPRQVEKLLISKPKRPNRKTIFKTPPKTEPSLWIFAPKGMTISTISFGTPIALAATRLIGIEAALEQVASAVTEGSNACRQKTPTPSLPAAI